MFEISTADSAAISAVAAAVAAISSAISVTLSRRSIRVASESLTATEDVADERENYDRRTRTLEVTASFSDRYKETRRELRQHFSLGERDQLSSAQCMQLRQAIVATGVGDEPSVEARLGYAVRDLLNECERLGVGCKYQVLDEELIYDLTNSNLRRLYKTLIIWIQEAQAKQATAYEHFVLLAEAMEKKAEAAKNAKK
jgi:hypothetical protein